MGNHHPDFRNMKLLTVRELLDFNASFFPDEPAFEWREGKEKSRFISYAELERLACFAHREAAKFVAEGEAVALLGSNSIEWVIGWLAITAGGHVAVPPDKDLPIDEIAELIRRSGAKLLIHTPPYAKKAKQIAALLPGVQMFALDFEKLSDAANDTSPEWGLKPEPDALATIVFTSGTTGEAKGVMLSHRNLLLDTFSSCRQMNNFERMLMLLPLHHTFALVTALLDPMAEHVPVFICKNLRHISRDIAFAKPDVISMVPAIMNLLHDKIFTDAENRVGEKKLNKALKFSAFLMKIGVDRRRKIFSAVHEVLGGELKTIIVGGAPASEAVITDLISIGIDCYNGYGITECSPIVSVNPAWRNKPGTVGVPLKCCEVKIIEPDENGNGEVAVKGENVFAGYFDDELATDAAFSGEWYLTGDIGKLDCDGYLSITGRKKNLIILANGKNVSPEEMEEKLLKYDAIEEIVISGTDGILLAEIYPAEIENKEEVIKETVREFNCSQPNYKNIVQYKLRDNPFEKTSTMKIKR